VSASLCRRRGARRRRPRGRARSVAAPGVVGDGPREAEEPPPDGRKVQRTASAAEVGPHLSDVPWPESGATATSRDGRRPRGRRGRSRSRRRRRGRRRRRSGRGAQTERQRSRVNDERGTVGPGLSVHVLDARLDARDHDAVGADLAEVDGEPVGASASVRPAKAATGRRSSRSPQRSSQSHQGARCRRSSRRDRAA